MAKPPRDAKRASARSAARLAAVQALYQMDMTARDLTEVIAEFESHRLAAPASAGEEAQADTDFFRALVKGVVQEQLRIDPCLDKHLAEGWRLYRLDSILRAILRAGAYELFERPDVPAPVVISEYLNLAHAFFAGEEPGVVNGILDRLAREARSDDISAKDTAGR